MVFVATYYTGATDDDFKTTISILGQVGREYESCPKTFTGKSDDTWT